MYGYFREKLHVSHFWGLNVELMKGCSLETPYIILSLCLIFVFFFYVLLSENRVTKEHDTAMNKLFDWLARFELQLNETLQSVKEFHSKDRISEAKTYVVQLDELKDKVQEFLDEVW